MRSISVGVFVATWSLAACGGSTSAPKHSAVNTEVARAATAYWTAVGDGNTRTICASYSRVVQLAYKRISGSCRAYVKTNHLGGNGQRPGKVSATVVHGSNATATLPVTALGGATLTQRVTLRREHGSWRVVQSTQR